MVDESKPINGVAAKESRLSRPDPFVVYVSMNFIIATLLGSSMLAFGVGQAARRLIVPPQIGVNASIVAPTSEMQRGSGGGMPHPIMSNGRKAPRTIYTSKNYDTGRTVSSDSLLLREELTTQQQFANDEWVQCNEENNDCGNAEKSKDDEEDEEEVHEPAGQHLLIDIQFVDENFLNSKERLAQAMLELVNRSGLTLLSYHCHGLEPAGVSCAGVLLESHVSFHTWPIPGVITLDLFTCGPNSLMPFVPLIKQLFAIPRATASVAGEEEPHVLWAYKRRGFRKTEGYEAAATDLFSMLLGFMEYEMKSQIASVETPFQTVEVYDVIHPRFNSLDSYKKSLSNDGSYESQHPELYRPDRIVYLDGVMQSRRYGDAAYHESLVHPSMFAHPKPEYVAIIGGGEGATLREVLKHDTVKVVVMVEIDELMVNTSKTHLPEWSDCSDIEGSTPSCFDDPRVKMVYGDAIQWFLDNYHPSLNDEPTDHDADAVDEFDVVIMDALDPGDNVVFSDLLFDNEEFSKSVYNSFGDEKGGIFISQTGLSDQMDDPSLNTSRAKHSIIFKDILTSVGFESIHDYDEARGGFFGVWSFFAAFTDATKKSLWFANEAVVNLEIHKRLRRSKSGQSLLKYFDGEAMQSYHFPSRATEVVFCRTKPDAFGCQNDHGFDPSVPEVTIEQFEVKESTIENAGRGLFATVDIPKGTYISIGESVGDVYVNPLTYALLYAIMKNKDFGVEWGFFDAYLYGYGFANNFFGGEDRSVDCGIAKFINHGCNDTYNVGNEFSVNEQTADENIMPLDWGWEDDVYNPCVARKIRLLMHSADYARRDIAAGEEIFDNFLNYASTEEMWKRAVVDLRKQCNKEHLGVITSFEEEDDDAEVES